MKEDDLEVKLLHVCRNIIWTINNGGFLAMTKQIYDDLVNAVEELENKPIESQLSEGGEEKKYTDKQVEGMMIEAQVAVRELKDEEIASLKKHNLKLTECLGELIKWVPDKYIAKETINKARSLINKKDASRI